MSFVDKLFIQKRYVDEVANRLDKFAVKRQSPYMALFRCHICGDSQKNKHKRRGYLLEKDSNIVYYCHNGCGTFGFNKYLKTYHPDLYQKYTFDLLREMGETRERKKQSKNKFQTFIAPTEDYLKGLSNIRMDAKAFDYIKSRKIEGKYYDDIWYTARFVNYINSHVPGKFSEEVETKFEHGRIIFPLRDRDGTCFGLSARSINGEEPKYLTIKFAEDRPKIFGLDRVDFSKHLYVLEGPIDSFFLPNAVALAGTDGDISSLNLLKTQYTKVLDNQPRNREVIGKYSKYIAAGERICIWPSNIQFKDINEMVVNGYEPRAIKEIIDTNSFSGIQATIRFNQYKKV